MSAQAVRITQAVRVGPFQEHPAKDDVGTVFTRLGGGRHACGALPSNYATMTRYLGETGEYLFNP